MISHIPNCEVLNLNFTSPFIQSTIVTLFEVPPKITDLSLYFLIQRTAPSALMSLKYEAEMISSPSKYNYQIARVLSQEPVITISLLTRARLETIAVCFLSAQSDFPCVTFQIMAKLS